MTSPISPRASTVPAPPPPLPDSVIARLESIVGVQRLERVPEVMVGGVRPGISVSPADEGQLSGVLRTAAESGLTICTAGGGTKLDWGSPPSSCDILVRTTSLDAVVEYDPENLTLSAGAGARIASLAGLVARDGLVLPLDPPTPGAATLGGILATNDHGPRRLLHGSLRDVVLGIKAVLADGGPIKAGGRTIKNVTGYDVTRLFVGSMGSLGVLSEVTVRLLPGPSSARVAVVPLPGLSEATALTAALLRSHLVPSAMTLLSPRAARILLSEGRSPDGAAPTGAAPGSAVTGGIASWGRSGPVLVVGAEGHPAAVERQVRDVMEAAGRPAAARVTPEGEAETVWSALASVRAEGRVANLPVEAKVAVPLSGLAVMLHALEDGAAGEGGGVFWWAEAGSGTVAVRLAAPHGEGSDTAALVRLLRVRALELGGSLVVTDGASVLADEVDAWGPPPEGHRVMAALKDRFDPRRMLNPGRSAGGI